MSKFSKAATKPKAKFDDAKADAVAAQAANQPRENKPKGQQPMVGMKRTSIDLPEDHLKKVKIMAAAEGRRMADILREWIAEGLSKAGY